MFGFLNINKPVNITSHDVISYLRKITKIKRIGHAGTLDPFACGVLPVAIGNATRLFEYFDDDKEYIAEISFGKNTDTFDTEGQVTEVFDKKISEPEILNILENFQGEIEQIPPIYSAIKVNGKKLYEYAREGKNVELKPRKVTIENLVLKNFNNTEQKAEVIIKCSKGTYIRSLAYDIGKQLNCGAFLSKLTRTQAGNFYIKDSVNLYDIKTIEDVIKNLKEPTLNLPHAEINEIEAKKISMGQFLKNKQNFSDGDIIVLTHNNKMCAIAKIQDNLIKAGKVL
ncbi:tRNA pseudouridine(55) synthase TruB [bacterium]|nr:tRNA pseudouridine(55) synthase TruB [bacterium]